MLSIVLGWCVKMKGKISLQFQEEKSNFIREWPYRHRVYSQIGLNAAYCFDVCLRKLWIFSHSTQLSITYWEFGGRPKKMPSMSMFGKILLSWGVLSMNSYGENLLSRRMNDDIGLIKCWDRKRFNITEWL